MKCEIFYTYHTDAFHEHRDKRDTGDQAENLCTYIVGRVFYLTVNQQNVILNYDIVHLLTHSIRFLEWIAHVF